MLATRVPASAAWSANRSGSGDATAQSAPAGHAPTTNGGYGTSVVVSWASSTLSGGAAATGYLLKRYDTNNVAQAVGSNCNVTLTALTCTETGVSNGAWTY